MYHVVVYSGGMDSFTLLHQVLAAVPESRRHFVRPITFLYGQRHGKEVRYAQAECQRLGLIHELVDLRGISGLLQGSALTSLTRPIPEGHYEAETMRQTVVPGRNTIMLSIAMGYAESLLLKAEEGRRAQAELAIDHARREAVGAVVHYGAHAGDHHIYPDCRPGYFTAMAKSFERATDDRVILSAPFLHKSKRQIAEIGLQLGIDYRRSWTCYKGEAEPCGKCGSCTERLEAFEALGRQDPAMAQPSLI